MRSSSFLAASAAVAFALVAAACGSDTGPGGESAELRVMHARNGAPAVDLVVDGRTVVRGVSYTKVSDFAEVAAGDVAFELRDQGGRVLVRGDASLEAGRRYTALLGGARDSTGASVVLDTAGTPFTPPPQEPGDTGVVPGEGKVKLRVVHNAPDAPALDVYLTENDADLAGATRLVEPFTPGVGQSPEFPGYVEREPGVWRLRFTEDNTLNVLLDTGPIHMAPGMVQTVILASTDTTGLGLVYVRER
jgi:hypothetical protein